MVHPRTLAQECLMGLALIMTGCGRHDEVKLTSVTGTVTFNGKPLPDASVIFNPAVTPSLGKLATGRTDEQGNFVLYTDSRPGAGPATYDVTIIAEQQSTGVQAASAVPSRGGNQPEQPSPAMPKLLIPEKYTKPTESGLSYTVASAGNNHFKIELTAAP